MNRGLHIIFILALTSVMPLWGSAPHRIAVSQEPYVDDATGIVFLCDDKTEEAEIGDSDEWLGELYSQETLTVPAVFVLTGGGASNTGSRRAYTKTYKVTALGEYAFRKAAASRLDFEVPSNLRTVKAFALTQMQSLKGTLVLPEGVKTIEHDGIGGTGMPTHKVVLPATLTELGLSAIVLTAADTLEFLGDAPPACATAESGDALNPWTSAAGATAKDIVVIVPDGRLAAYKAQKGLGDWFTGIREKSGNATGTVQTAADGRRQGVWSVTGQYMGETPAALPSGIYIINGRKTAL
ncbi:MAG: hypothetical protein II970_03485 [Paludibacteraceae bacterium]|nr:hypothetical protein [Paludibacteraceae bacterium]